MVTALRAFLRHPADHLAADTSLRTCVRALLILLVVDLGATMLLGGVIGLISESGLVDMENHAAENFVSDTPGWQLYLLAGLIVPFVEELIFRLPLRYQTNPVVGVARLLTPATTPDVDAALAADRRASWDRHFPKVFYALTLLFAFVHLSNYPDWSTALLLVSPLLVAPQFVMGCIAGFLRVRYGFVWAFLLHALHNALLISVALLAPDEVPEVAPDPELLEGLLLLIPLL